MKVILINGSPHEFGCTYTALAELERTLQEEGVETEMIHIGKEPVGGCLGCGQASSFFDRLFFASGGRFANKLGTGVVSCRRGGASAAFDELNKYFTVSNMPVVSGTYWNQVHGNTPNEVKQDLEGMQNMRPEHGLAAEMY